MKEGKKILIEKASHYASIEKEVHIVTDNSWFYNGIIVDVNDFRIIILDKKLGETYISMDEIKEIEPYIGEDKLKEGEDG